MIDALIAGKLHNTPTQRQSHNGNTFTTALVKASTGEETIFVSVIAFEGAVQRALLAMGAGESISLSGALKPKVYEGRDGSVQASLDMVAGAVLSPYHIKKRRDAAQGAAPAKGSSQQSANQQQDDYPDDDLPL